MRSEDAIPEESIDWVKILYADPRIRVQTADWNDRLSHFGPRLNVKKNECFTTDADELGTIRVDDTNLPKTSPFKYLGSTLSADGSLALEVIVRIDGTWMKRRSMTAALCDKNIPHHLKSKVYRTAVHPVALYGAECWPATKEVKRSLGVLEMRMLRWMTGISRLDHVCNHDIRERFDVAAIADKLREAHLRSYGHVLSAENESVCKISLNREVPEKRPKGRLNQRWLDTLHVD